MRTFGDVLSGNFTAAPLGAALKAGRVFVSFGRIVGPKMAAHWRPVKLEGSRLYIACSGPTFKHELLYQAKRILGELTRQIPQVTVTELCGFVSSKVTEHPAEAYPQALPSCHTKPAGEVTSRAQRIASPVKDPALKARFEALLSLVLGENSKRVVSENPQKS